MTTDTRQARIDAAAKSFHDNTASHVLEIVHDDGLYRHLQFRRPASSGYWFDLITWPGRLTFDGSPGAWTFARLDDMLSFFRPGRGEPAINPGYWAEKVRGETPTSAYSEDLFRQIIGEYASEHSDDWPGLTAAVKESVLDDPDLHFEAAARDALDAFQYSYGVGEERRTYRFTDAWEWDFRDYRPGYLWACHAIVWGIAEYDRAKA